MKRPATLQEWIHWLEEGAGARWIRRGAVLLGLLLLSLRAVYTQFHGPAHELTLLQADVGRQLAGGHGFTTLVNYPQTAALMQARHRVAVAHAGVYPELHQAPLYAVVIAAGLRMLPAAWRAALFAPPAAPTDGFKADYYLLGLNLALLWIAAGQTFRLGRRLFDERVGGVGMLALMLSVGGWEEVGLVDGLPLLMVLALGAFQLLAAVEASSKTDREAEPGRLGRRRAVRLFAFGCVGALLFLAEYSAGLLLPVGAAYAGWRFRGRSRWLALAVVIAGFALPAAPWIVRNLRLTGSPVGLALQNVALKAGDPTAEPAVQRTLFTTEPPVLELNKLGNKGLTGLQRNVQERMWSGGGYFLAAFFVAGWLYQFRRPAANRVRWVFTAALLLLAAGQPFLNSGESLRLPVCYLLPLVLIFGAGFFFVLVESSAALGANARLAAAVLLALQAAPLVHDVLQPRQGPPFHYPPYYPALFMRIHAEIERRGGLQGMSVMADVPAGVAWYGRQRVWAQPDRIRDFYALMIEQPVGLLLLTPVTLDRPFFAQLAVGGLTPEAGSQKYQGWGPVYVGLVTGRMPPEFPLPGRQKLTENLMVLLNPAILPLR
ncbi:MAG: hypothetical protein PHE83_13790 [Opitutaceae bacterium]|nr:hypothetical protein [Opitutaceae bacterium]